MSLYSHLYSETSISAYKSLHLAPLRNTFSPGAGSPPPELVGRRPILEQARILSGRVLLRKPEKSLLLTGLRDAGEVYSPAHGDMAFTVPLFDEFMRRAIPERPRRS